MKTMSLHDFRKHYFSSYPNSTMRFGQLFCLVFIPHKNDWQQLYNETDLYTANKLIYRFILDNNLGSDNIPLLREDLL
tara:strand:+ start:111 stop:344 length:234 start_codon:yes stop_codon:yes gene_type:complete